MTDRETTIAALTRAVFDRPRDYTPKGVLADYLADTGVGEDAERAELIHTMNRWQAERMPPDPSCKVCDGTGRPWEDIGPNTRARRGECSGCGPVAAKRRIIELVKLGLRRSWFGIPGLRFWSEIDLRLYAGGLEFGLKDGFVATVKSPDMATIDGGHTWRRAGRRKRKDPCPVCGWAGPCGDGLRTLFRAAPIGWVFVTNRRPVLVKGGAGWTELELPAFVFDRLGGTYLSPVDFFDGNRPPVRTTARMFRTKADADDALSIALVNAGRAATGLAELYNPYAEAEYVAGSG